jgi:hypothetical protein
MPIHPKPTEEKVSVMCSYKARDFRIFNRRMTQLTNQC